jgi:hypothetical protein
VGTGFVGSAQKLSKKNTIRWVELFSVDVGPGANETTNKSNAMKLPTSVCLCISPLVGASSLCLSMHFSFGRGFLLVWVFHRLELDTHARV